MKTVISIFALGCLLALALTGCQSVYVTSAKVYLQQNDLENAKKQLQEGLAQNPKDPEAHFLLGEIYSRQKMYPEMLQEFNSCLALNQKRKADIDNIKLKHYRELFNNAVEKFNKQQYPEAEADLQMALAIRPESLESWSLMGKAHINQKDFPAAQEGLKKAIALDPKFENMGDRILLMQVYYGQQEYLEALNSAEEVLRKDGGNLDAAKIGAFCYNELASQETDATKKAALQAKAIDYFNKVLQTQPDNADMAFNLGILYEKMEKYDLAVAEYERTLTLNPKDGEAAQRAAFLCLEKLKDNKKAIELYTQAVAINPSAANYTNLGVAQIQEGSATGDQRLIEAGKENIQKGKSMSGENP